MVASFSSSDFHLESGVLKKRGFPGKCACVVLFRPIKKRLLNLVCVWDLRQLSSLNLRLLAVYGATFLLILLLAFVSPC